MADDDDFPYQAKKKQKTSTRVRIVKVYKTSVGKSPDVVVADIGSKATPFPTYTVTETKFLPSFSPLVVYTFADGVAEKTQKGFRLVAPVTEFEISSDDTIPIAEFKTWALSASSMSSYDACMIDIRRANADAKKEKKKDEEDGKGVIVLDMLKKISSNSTPGGRLARALFHNVRLLTHADSRFFLDAFASMDRVSIELLHPCNTTDDAMVAWCKSFVQGFRDDPLSYVMKNQWWIPRKFQPLALIESAHEASIIDMMFSIEPYNYCYDVDETTHLQLKACMGSFRNIEGDDVFVRHCHLELEKRMQSYVDAGIVSVERRVVCVDFHHRRSSDATLLYGAIPKPFKLYGTSAIATVCSAISWGGSEMIMRNGSSKPLLVDSQLYAMQLMHVERGDREHARKLLLHPGAFAETTPNGSIATYKCFDKVWWGVLEVWYDARADATHMTLVFSTRETQYTPYNTSVYIALGAMIGTRETPWRVKPESLTIQEAHLMTDKAWHTLFLKFDQGASKIIVSGDASNEALSKEYPRGVLFRALLKLPATRVSDDAPPIAPFAPLPNGGSYKLSPSRECALNSLFESTEVQTVHKGMLGALQRAKRGEDGSFSYEMVLYDDVYHNTLADGVVSLDASQKCTAFDVAVRRVSGATGRTVHNVISFESKGFTRVLKAPKTIYITDVWHFPAGALKNAELVSNETWSTSQLEKARWLMGERDADEWRKKIAHIKCEPTESADTMLFTPVFLLQTL
jgi:hypothetical protein